MKKYMILLLYVVLASWSANAQAKSGSQAQSKAEKKHNEEMKRINMLLKEYQKNPQAFKKMLDKNKQNMDSIELIISLDQATIKEMTTNLAFQQNKVTSLESELKNCQNKDSVECPPCASQGAIPATGTIYKIQLGTFKNADISDNFTSKFLGIEKVDGKFRYMLSYFEDYPECIKFVAELKKLGIEGAVAVRYEDGKRVVLDSQTEPQPVSKPAVKPAPVAPRPAARATKPGAKQGFRSATKPAAKPVKKAPVTQDP